MTLSGMESFLQIQRQFAGCLGKAYLDTALVL